MPTRRRIGARFDWIAPALFAGVAFALAPGCASSQPKPPPPAKTIVKQSDKAWLDAKALCILPLAKHEVPSTPDGLIASMLAGWNGVVTFRDPAAVVDIRGGTYPSVEELTVDLTDAVVNPAHKRPAIGDPKPSPAGISAARFTMRAEPMVQGKSQVNFRLTGNNVRFDLQRNKSGEPILMLADATDGSLHFDAARADIERLMLAGAKGAGAKRLLFVRSVDFDLQSVGPRTVLADLHVSTLVGFIPAGLRFRARVDVDDKMNATISNLTCDGDEILGPLIVGFVRPGLAKYNNQTRPLLGFPSGKLKLRDVRIDAGERVTLDATFGG